MTLAAVDAGSGIAGTEYKIGAAGAWTAYGAPFTLAAEGVTTVWFRSTDAAGTREEDHSIEVRISLPDPTTPPGPTIPATPTNLALRRPATASTARGRTFAASRAVDGRRSTSWRSRRTSRSQWVRVDLQAPQSISNVKVVWPATGYARKFRIQTSTDGASFTTVYSRTLRGAGRGGATNAVFAAASARYVRILCALPGGSSSLGVAELEVYR